MAEKKYIIRDDGKIAAWQILEGMGYSIKHNDRLVEEVESVFDEIPAADVVERPRWIPVTERLPEEMETVLITDGKNVGWSFCVNDYGTMEFYSAWEVTHWMPLPEPPKEET